MLVIGGVIGSGIFLVPGAIQRRVGNSVGLAILVWVAGGFMSLVGALTYGELAAMKPEAGGLYVYIRDCFGRLPAFLYGWTLFLVIASGGIATLAVAFSAYLGQIIPLSAVAMKVAAVGMIAVITLVNIYGTRESSDLQNWTTYVKVAADSGNERCAAGDGARFSRLTKYFVASTSEWLDGFEFWLGDDCGDVVLRRLAVRFFQRR